MLISKRKKSYNRKKKLKLKPGIYTSTVVNIDFRLDYDDEYAILVEYTVEDDNGNEYPFKETFFNVINNYRTQKFYSYLIDNGISLQNYRTFIGCTEEFILEEIVKDNVPFITIRERKFIAKAGGADEI